MKSVLIANRGEIAVRVVRACRDLGLRSVAVYSEADRGAPHVLLADEARLIGAAPSSESYLCADRILDAAAQSGADAIHPGYGFLAESAAFARAVEDAGLIFVGPAPETIEAMGNKTAARRRMRAAGVPIVPGTLDPVVDVEEALEAAHEVGFPLLLKAAAGGGGKGMRVVTEPAALPRALEAARREAAAAFGDGSMYLERYLDRPRHIEIQILGDRHGQVIHLGERECSIQRRHQKLVEEAPSTALTSAVRREMGEAAVCAARAVDYRGAGTVEFLFQDGQFHFLEMNTRIQVEHPVTELVTGIDLVGWQLRVARGERLPWGQEEVKARGHAVECRITAENPGEGFLPSTGTVEQLEIPSGPGVRWDGGIAAGNTVSPHYDSLLGKLIVWAPSREEALRRMDRALRELVIDGVEHCGAFHLRLMQEPDFLRGDLTVRYLEEHPETLREPESARTWALAAAVAALLERERRAAAVPPRLADGSANRGVTPWVAALHPWKGAR